MEKEGLVHLWPASTFFSCNCRQSQLCRLPFLAEVQTLQVVQNDLNQSIVGRAITDQSEYDWLWTLLIACWFMLQFWFRVQRFITLMHRWPVTAQFYYLLGVIGCGRARGWTLCEHACVCVFTCICVYIWFPPLFHRSKWFCKICKSLKSYWLNEPQS